MRLMDSPACVVGENSQAMQIIKRHKPNNDIAECLDSVSCTTFNILAPVYKRINSETCRESQFREDWKKRNEEILEMLLKKKSSIICLQELWVGNGELVEMYERNLNSHGYDIYQLRRTNNREDGLLTAIRKDHFQVLSCRELLFNDSGDRVAQLLHIKSATSFRRSQTKCIQQETLVVNTHLMFPHCSDVCLLRLRQVYKILEYLEAYKAENKLPPMPILLCGDWNGSKRGHVYKFLRSQGFLSSYDTARRYTDSDADAHKWVSHRNHRGNICGVDFIWLFNPDNQKKSLKASWNDAVFGIIKSKLKEAGLKEMDAFCFFKSEGRPDWHVTLPEFHGALQQLGLTSSLIEGLSAREIEDLFAVADTGADGVIDFGEFQMMLDAFSELSPRSDGDSTLTCESPTQYLSLPLDFNTVFENNVTQESSSPVDVAVEVLQLEKQHDEQESTFGFDVEKASLFPPEVERGMWPDNYVLSDHATLTVFFTPVKIPRIQASVFQLSSSQ